MTEPPKKSASSSASIELFKKAYLKSPSEKVDEIKRGIPAHRIGSLAVEMSVSQTSLLNAMGLSETEIKNINPRVYVVAMGYLANSSPIFRTYCSALQNASRLVSGWCQIGQNPRMLKMQNAFGACNVRRNRR